MTSEVLYRKWRSRTFSELVGQDHVTTTLQNALRTGRLGHAYLFTGPRGTGKTSTARLLAKAINCLNNGQGEPCNTCESCVSIMEGRALDLVEIDAASNSRVDDVRELIERVDYQPAVGRKRIYIVDEVHMLSTSAFNALLKTLEEPPPHIVFILATTDVQKLPATVLSRCQRFDFRRVAHEAMVGRLEFIAAEENLELEEGVLSLIARASQGSLRDANNLLDQMVVFFGQSITLAQARELLGIGDERDVLELVTAVLEGNVGRALGLVQDLVDRGVDPRQLSGDAIQVLREGLLVKAGRSLAGRDEESARRFGEAFSSTGVAEIARVLGVLGQADFKMEGPAALPLELAIVSACSVPPAGTVHPSGGSASAPVAAPAPARPVAAPSTPQETRMVPTPAAVEPQRAPAPPPPAAPPSPPDATSPPSAPRPEPAVPVAPAGSVGLDDLDRLYETVLAEFKGSNFQGVLRGCRFLDLQGDTLTVGCQSSFHKGRVEDPNGTASLVTAVERLTGQRVRIVTTIETGSRGPRSRAAASPADEEEDYIEAAMRNAGARTISQEETGR